MKRYTMLAFVHNDGADDYPFSACLGMWPGRDDGKECAEEVARDILKLLDSKDLTDFKVLESELNMEVCKNCRQYLDCFEEVEE